MFGVRLLSLSLPLVRTDIDDPPLLVRSLRQPVDGPVAPQHQPGHPHHETYPTLHVIPVYGRITRGPGPGARVHL